MFKDDQAWVLEQVNKLPYPLRSKTIDMYKKVYEETYQIHNGEGELLQIQHARTTANTRLRKYVQVVSEKLSARNTNR